jgi:hypothetical protein
VIEAGQAGIPVLAMKNHGSASLLVRSGTNGELTWSFRKFPRILNAMLQNYEKYDCSINNELLEERRWFEPIVREISKSLASDSPF